MRCQSAHEIDPRSASNFDLEGARDGYCPEFSALLFWLGGSWRGDAGGDVQAQRQLLGRASSGSVAAL